MTKVKLTVYLEVDDADWADFLEQRKDRAYANPVQEELRDLEDDVARQLKAHRSMLSDYVLVDVVADMEGGNDE